MRRPASAFLPLPRARATRSRPRAARGTGRARDRAPADRRRRRRRTRRDSARRCRETRRGSRVRRPASRRPCACTRPLRHSPMDTSAALRIACRAHARSGSSAARIRGGTPAGRCVARSTHTCDEAPGRSGLVLALPEQPDPVDHRRAAEPRHPEPRVDHLRKRERAVERAGGLDDDADHRVAARCRARPRGSGARSPRCRSTSSRSRC